MNQGNRNKLSEILWIIIPCVIVVLAATVYTSNFWPEFNLTILNILCVPALLLMLVRGLTEEVNTWKALKLAGAVMAAVVGILLNLSADKITLQNFQLTNLSTWSFG